MTPASTPARPDWFIGTPYYNYNPFAYQAEYYQNWTEASQKATAEKVKSEEKRSQKLVRQAAKAAADGVVSSLVAALSGRRDRAAVSTQSDSASTKQNF